MPTQRSIEERFHEKYEIVEPGGCWVWTGATTHGGYGQLRVVFMAHAHRVSWELHYGPIPPGICVLHKCDNPPCVNPEHLWLGTSADNTADMVAKGRARKCGVRGEAHYKAHLTDDQVAEIRVIGRSMVQREIGDLFGVGQPLISLILNNQRRSTP